MLVSLSELISTPKREVKLEIPIELEGLSYQGIVYPFIDKPPIHLVFLSDEKKRVIVKGNAEYTLAALCSRCLTDVSVKIPVSISVSLNLNKGIDRTTTEEEEHAYFDGYNLDIDELIREELLLQFPSKILCKEDCKGICKACGKNLNQGECGCEKTSLDPRMAAIQDIFKNFKEV